MQMLHREMRYTCCQLAWVSKWLVAPLLQKEALQLVGIPVDAKHQVINQQDAHIPITKQF
jgi:hypothetical protein